jgi:2-C-methyl-D-erythritol 2,4-cyclodiphosphate synthase
LQLEQKKHERPLRHRLRPASPAEGRKLIIGGIEVPFDKGPVGHSDGDVVAHALCDALFGAAGLGDIGTHFPRHRSEVEGANSLQFLEYARKLLDEKHLAIEHVDAVVILSVPSSAPFPQDARSLGESPASRNPPESQNQRGVDAVGRGEAIAAHVVATLSL